MNRGNRLIHAWIGIGVAVVIGALGAGASAAIIGIDGAVSTTVQELIDGVPGSVSSDSDQFDGDSASLPLAASGNLVSTDLEGVLVLMGQGFSGFSDPTRLDQPNPEEFALEVACYSNAESVAYSVRSSAEELRTVVFTRPGSTLAPSEINFGIGSTATVESRIFLSGAVIFWTTESGQDLDDMLSELRVTVTRDDTNATLFETTLTVAGENADEVRPTATGPIRFEVVDLDDLRNEGVDEDTISILEEVDREGTLIVLVIPPQEHAYTYRVTADESFVLRAELEARVRNTPGGTGVAAVLGRPFQNLADFIEHGLPGVDGRALQKSINSMTAAREIGIVPTDESSARTSGSRLCGAFGFEGVALAALALFVTLGRSRH